MMDAYDKFIAGKVRKPQSHGFEPKAINPMLFDWQQVVVSWAIRQGRCALFEDCGLGKTPQQLEWARQVCEHTGKAVLILAPLAVADQTVREGEKFGIKVTHCRQPEDVDRHGVNIINYERLELFEDLIAEGVFAGVVLDESSILKSFTGKTRHKLTLAFAQTQYRLCCTATPAPNDFTELGQHAEFLGVCTAPEMLAMWFINDTADTGTWRLKKHAADDFWRWVASWAACVSKPSDLGFSDDGFTLPPLNMHPVWVDVDETAAVPDGELFRNPELNATNINREMRITLPDRCAAVAKLVTDDDKWAVWCNLNDEQDALEDLFGTRCVSVRGSDRDEHKVAREHHWRTGDVPVMVSKGSIFGYGMNWQHCHNLTYFPSYSFEDFYQVLRRFYRYGQAKAVNCYVVLPKTANGILRTLKAKIEKHEVMREAMKFSAENLLKVQRITTMKTDINTATGELWTLHHGDCVRVAKSIPSESVDFSVFSPPFADLFVYSSDIQDMGNCASMDDFLKQFNFLVRHLYRVTAPGRLCAVHCADLLATKWKDGEIELKGFSNEIVELFEGETDALGAFMQEKACNTSRRMFSDAGWLFHCRVTIWKDPVVEMQRTKSLGLLHKQLLKDSCMSRVGSPEYVMVFRKPGKNPKPVTHAREDYPVEQWQLDASPVWMDIRQTEVLNGKVARENQDEKHICPLQLDTINRLLRLYTNPGDMVYSPFAGIGSEGYCAVKMKRRFIGSELKQSYFELACSYLRKAEDESHTLFDKPNAEIRLFQEVQ